jgi:hypothetical protein
VAWRATGSRSVIYIDTPDLRIITRALPMSAAKIMITSVLTG